MEQIRTPLNGTPLVLPQASHPCGDAQDMPLHPADELAQIRAELKRLHQREDELRRFFREDAQEVDLNGETHRVTVTAHKKRMFDSSKLPQTVLANPKFYRSELRTFVVTTEKPLALPRFAILPVADMCDAEPADEPGLDALPI